MDSDDSEEEEKKRRKRLQQQQLDETPAVKPAQPDEYARVAPVAETLLPAAFPPKLPVPDEPKADDYGRATQPANNGDALRQYFQACQDNDATAATKVAEENHFSPTALRHGINMLVITHQNYEGAGGLLSKCGLAGAAGVDAGFMNDLLDRTRDKEGAVSFLQGAGATFNDEHMMKIQSTNPEAAIRIIKAGQFDATENGSRCLLHAAGDGQKSVFNALMEAGANPLTAIQKGSNDPRNEGMYETATKWAGEFYKAHPEITPPKQDAVSLEAVSERKISTLAPSVPRR